MKRPRTADEHNRDIPPGREEYPRRDDGRTGQNRRREDKPKGREHGSAVG